MSQTETAQLLNGLLQTLEDAKLNFAEAASKLGKSRLSQLLGDYSDDCTRALHVLQKSVQSLGETAAVGASAGGMVRQGWIKLKSALAADTESAVIEEAQREHARVRAAFDKVLKVEPIESVREVIGRERQVLDHAAELLLNARARH